MWIIGLRTLDFMTDGGYVLCRDLRFGDVAGSTCGRSTKKFFPQTDQAGKSRMVLQAAVKLVRGLSAFRLPHASLSGLFAAVLLISGGPALALDRSPVEDAAVGGQQAPGIHLAGFMTDTQAEVLSRIAPAAGPAATSPQSAYLLVKRLGDNFTAVMTDTRLAVAQRQQALRNLLLAGFEVDTIGRIVLGPYWRTATPAQLSEYRRLFQDFLVKRYMDRFTRYGIAQIALTGARPSKRNLAIIESKVTVPGKSAVRIDWLVRNTNGGQRVIDLVVNGISMAVTQRLEFTSIIKSSGGNLDALLAALRAKNT
jgi:phospholipid transport system substrate-binding protein